MARWLCYLSTAPWDWVVVSALRWDAARREGGRLLGVACWDGLVCVPAPDQAVAAAPAQRRAA